MAAAWPPAAARLYAPPGAPVLRPGQILREGLPGLPGRITNGARGLGWIQHVTEVASGFPGPLLPPRAPVLVWPRTTTPLAKWYDRSERGTIPLPTAAAAGRSRRSINDQNVKAYIPSTEWARPQARYGNWLIQYVLGTNQALLSQLPVPSNAGAPAGYGLCSPYKCALLSISK